ncbi:MAG: serine hydrolase [Gemmatimonadota bacterium]|nr:MAG: serine hydrolase [Gemmatimonadota bacterium]
MTWKRGVFGFLALALTGFSTPDLEAQDREELALALDSYIEAVMERLEIPGLTLAVTRGEEVVYTGAFGVRSLESGEPMRAEYLFHMASVSKPFVATAVLQLAEQGRIDLDEPVVTYLPYFELADERYREITVRQMLNHTSGMPDVDDYEWDKPEYDDGAAERYVRSLIDEQMIAAPGELWRYSNMAFDVMGDVIAKVSGRPFEIYVKENILNPLGMSESNFLYAETSEELRTTGHVWRLEPVVSDVYPYNRRHAPSSTLNSSVLEMTNWAFANLNRGELNGERILTEESYETLWTASAQVDEDRHVGLSWFLGSHRGIETVGHSGGDRGYSSQFTLLPAEGIGVIVASNYDRAPTWTIRDGVLDILLGYEPTMPKRHLGMAFAKEYVEQGIDAAKALYRRIEAEAADEYEFGDRQLAMVGWYFMDHDQVDQAIEVFRFNVQLFPTVGPYYELAEAYEANGNRELAIENYSKALELRPDSQTLKKKLAELRGIEPPRSSSSPSTIVTSTPPRCPSPKPRTPCGT